MFVYKIYGLPGFDEEGLVFNSCVSNLHVQPDLWLDECPYLFPRPASQRLKGLRVELVGGDDGTCAPPPTLPRAQAA